MSTRGAYGFYKNGVDKITYNHYDSYFSGLGEEIVNFCRNTTIEDMNKIFDKIILVKEDDKPTIEDMENYVGFSNLKVGEQTLQDWYCLLRDTQGNLEEYKKENVKHMIDNKEFLGNSLFCEYAYIINLTTNKLEIYTGFNKRPTKNRYAKYRDLENNSGYYECKLVHSFDLTDIPENWIKILNKKGEE